jgi:hypothetical protein
LKEALDKLEGARQEEESKLGDIGERWRQAIEGSNVQEVTKIVEKYHLKRAPHYSYDMMSVNIGQKEK